MYFYQLLESDSNCIHRYMLVLMFYVSKQKKGICTQQLCTAYEITCNNNSTNQVSFVSNAMENRGFTQRHTAKNMPKIRLKVTLQNVKHIKLKLHNFHDDDVSFKQFNSHILCIYSRQTFMLPEKKAQQTKEGVRCMQNVLPDGNLASS